ncbi:hypothetical protein LEP1GSC050_3007 [Leptospira broomii serovar Hurstbridge str. 5399]|uniref:Uncharacterized protein n=1 Tax=Leptospira broomii serovar Hurstbridge str. 5399 TaxID=1049789 RepID=T0GEQ8_9LEPT|nr:hypothetical protein LEP1GSC050_3007 [Leptospira broomii serovar Hurstbridge str. 5399]
MLNLKNVLQERDIYDISQSLIRLGTSTAPAPAQKGGDHSKKLPHSEYLTHRTIQTNRRTNFRVRSGRTGSGSGYLTSFVFAFLTRVKGFRSGESTIVPARVGTPGRTQVTAIRRNRQNKEYV